MLPIFDLPWWGYVLIALGLTHITIISVTLYLHRHQAHCALSLHPALSHFFRFWLWLTTGTVTKQWVAVHRKHHANVESENDPHSPQIVGINAVLWGGLLLYRKEARVAETLEKYGKGTPDDWVERNIYSRFTYTGIFALLALNTMLFGLIAGPAIWVVEMLWIPFWAAGVINGVGHYAGYRNYELNDASRNIVPWGLLIGGEELHNNHHAFASSAQFSTKWWEVDLGWWYIKLLSAMRLVKIRRKIPVLSYRSDKTLDTDTAKVFVTHRFHLVSVYVRDVLKDVCREEIKAATGDYRKMFKRTYRLVITEKSRLSGSKLERLQKLLQSNRRLREAYAMKESLQNIAFRSSASYEALRNSLEEWCRKADESGIEALMRYSSRLRGCASA